ncbi:unnamed protein product, partial [Closterium sp. NIES-65]
MNDTNGQNEGQEAIQDEELDGQEPGETDTDQEQDPEQGNETDPEFSSALEDALQHEDVSSTVLLSHRVPNRMGYLVSPISPTTSSASQLDLITKGAENDSLSPPLAGIRRSHSISETSKSELHPFPCPQSHGSGFGCSCNGALAILLPEFQLSGRLEEEEENV